MSKEIANKKVLPEKCDVKLVLGTAFENEARPVGLTIKFSEKHENLIEGLKNVFKTKSEKLEVKHFCDAWHDAFFDLNYSDVSVLKPVFEILNQHNLTVFKNRRNSIAEGYGDCVPTNEEEVTRISQKIIEDGRQVDLYDELTYFREP